MKEVCSILPPKALAKILQYFINDDLVFTKTFVRYCPYPTLHKACSYLEENDASLLKNQVSVNEASDWKLL